MASTGLERMRERQRALRLAADLAVLGRQGDIPAALEAAGLAGAYTDAAELAVAAQRAWWHRVLGRLDAALDDDLVGVTAEERTAATRRAWHATAVEYPGHLALVDPHAEHPAVVRDSRRYARLLALFAGLAAVDDPLAVAAAAGAKLAATLRAEGARLGSVPRAGGSTPGRQCRMSRLLGARPQMALSTPPHR